MARPIVHCGGLFFEWSSVVDAPLTYGMRLPEFETYYREEYGREGMKDLSTRLDRAIRQGTSLLSGESAEDLMGHYNRAGFRETFLTIPQIIQIYCVERREPVEGEGIVPLDEDD